MRKTPDEALVYFAFLGDGNRSIVRACGWPIYSIVWRSTSLAILSITSEPARYEVFIRRELGGKKFLVSR
jgi:hypothetical protein